MISPCGAILLIKVDGVEKKTAGGIVLPDKHVEREQKGAGVGTVVAIGPLAWSDDKANGFDDWCKVGDKVVFNRYEGIIPPIEGMDDGTYRLINDNTIMAVIK